MAVPITAGREIEVRGTKFPLTTVREAWGGLKPRYDAILWRSTLKLDRGNHVNSPWNAGNRETTLSKSAWTKARRFWFMLHSGSRGVGNCAWDRTFIELAKKDMETFFVNLPDRDLAVLPRAHGTLRWPYVEAVEWA